LIDINQEQIKNKKKKNSTKNFIKKSGAQPPLYKLFKQILKKVEMDVLSTHSFRVRM
jgi:hypothetical protein